MQSWNTMHCLTIALAFTPGWLIAGDPARVKTLTVEQATERAEEMFVRQAFRFFLGRNETLRDAATLRQACSAYAQRAGMA